MIQIGINGFGTIGKRVADAVERQPDMAVAGIAKRSPNFEARVADHRDIPLYAAADRDRFAGSSVSPAGDLDDLLGVSDVIVDTTPGGVGARYRETYESHDTPAIFQGGEDAGVAEASFNARANFEAAVDADYLRVLSCNSTALARALAPLDERYDVHKVRATIVRRGGDPTQTGRGPINDILPDPITMPSHHGPDVQTVLPGVTVETAGVKVPATLMHLQSLNVTFESAPDRDAIRDLLAGEPRVAMVPGELGFDGCAALKEYALDCGRPRGDLWETAVWEESLTVEGRDLYLFQAVHQESDVVPENVDAVRAVTGTADPAESRATTDESLGMGLAF